MADSKADTVLDEQTVSAQGVLCEVCRKALSPEHDSWRTFPEQTYAVFEKAVQSGCYVCLTVCKYASRYQIPWLRSQELWQPLSYHVYQSQDGCTIETCHAYRRKHRKFTSCNFSLAPEYKDEDWPFGLLRSIVQPEETLKTAKTWLENCLLGRGKCNAHRSEAAGRLPTRLIDVGKDGETGWKLCVPSEDRIPPSAEYLTLSYRWDPSPDILLLSSNLTSFRNGRPLNQLPILFQDVITAARYLGIRYVWVDALCIIQDSVEDWEAEAPTMCHVYSYARCNIAAIASSSPKEGLFCRTRDPQAIMPRLVELDSQNENPCYYYIYDRQNWEWQISESFLQDRGWVFQELWAAPRILYFGTNQLFFACEAGMRNEAIPGQQYPDWGLKHHPSKREILGSLWEFDSIELWSRLVCKYSKCKLTKTTDKLAAVAGMAKTFQGFIKGTYVAGLWTDQLVCTLNWAVKEPQQHRPLEYRAPSWSWASIDGTIRMPRSIAIGSGYLAEVMQVEVTTRTADPMSTVLKGFARLRGPLIPITVPHASEDGTSVIETRIESISMQISPDVLDGSIAAGKRVFLAPLVQAPGRSWPSAHLYGLILQGLPQKSDQGVEYRRAGQFYSEKPTEALVDWSKYTRETYVII